MSQPFRSKSGRRLSFEETVPRVRAEYGVELVGGLAQISECPGVRGVSNWPASFIVVKDVAWTVRQESGQFLSWLTEPVPPTTAPKVGFLFAMGTGMGSAVPQVSGAFEITVRLPQGEQIAQFLLPVVKSPQWRRDGSSLFLYAPRRVEVAHPGHALCLDSELTEESAASFGIALVVIEQERLAPGQPVQIRVTPRGRSSRRWLRLEPGKRYEDWNLPQVLSLLNAGPGRATATGQRVFFGDIHVHSAETVTGGHGCGEGSVLDNYHYARDAAGLDFFALTDHDWDIQTDTGWQVRQEAAREYDCPGRFAALLGFEWTSTQYGHRNVYYRDLAGPWFNAVTGRSKWDPGNARPADLYTALREAGVAALTIPHHPAYGYHPMAWDTLDPEFDRLVEIYSCWGSSEYAGSPYANIGSDTFEDLFVTNALKSGHRFGFIASSDGHDGCPGLATWPGPQSQNVHPQLAHPLGSGRAAVFAEELTREAVFDALCQSQCYATTGEPLVLTFSLDDHPMGSEIEASKLGDKPVLRLGTKGTVPMSKLQVVKNGRLLVSVDARETEEDLEIADEQFDACRPNFYYAKVIQRDHEMAWSSPIFVAKR